LAVLALAAAVAVGVAGLVRAGHQQGLAQGRVLGLAVAHQHLGQRAAHQPQQQRVQRVRPHQQRQRQLLRQAGQAGRALSVWEAATVAAAGRRG
jgi:hypothetical protein